MYRSKVFLITLTIVGILLLVYGTSILLYLLSGKYLMVGGLTNLNYAFLTILCLAPFLLYLLLTRKHSYRALEVILASGVLFAMVFLPVHSSLVLDGAEITQKLLIRLFTILPVYALILVCISHIMLRRK